MSPRRVLVPDDRHSITIRRTGPRVVVRLGEQVVADSTDALTLQEADYPPVQYLPRKDVARELLERTAHTSYCPYKGEAAYFALPGRPDAVWSYEHPYPAVEQIRDHVAFYPQHVAVELLAVGASTG